MKIYHIIEDYSLMSGGLRPVVMDLYNHVDLPSEIITTKKEPLDNEVTSFNPNRFWHHSKQLKNFLFESSKHKDTIFHLHGVWMYPQYIASKIAYRKQVPLVITPHGMFKSYLWKKGLLKKKIYFNNVTKKYFEKANVIHAITEDEKNDLVDLFKGKINIEVIPNLISTSQIPLDVEQIQGEKYVLFLGRIHPIKGIQMLIDAFSKINPKDFKLKIAGPKNEYQEELIRFVDSIGMSNKIEFLGMVKGDKKFELYKNAQVFVAPSYSEVIGMVNLEAAIMETPVITTNQTGLLNEWNQEGGILIKPETSELENALRQALSWTASERNDRGKKLKNFTIKNYSWEQNKYKWESLYNSLLNT